jgi:hypothetical protein
VQSDEEWSRSYGRGMNVVIEFDFSAESAIGLRSFVGVIKCSFPVDLSFVKFSSGRLGHEAQLNEFEVVRGR